MSRWQLTEKGGFIDISGVNPVGHETDLPEQIEPTRRRGGKYEEWRHQQRHPRRCSTQINVNKRRAVSWSMATLSARRSINSVDPSSCNDRLPTSIASI